MHRALLALALGGFGIGMTEFVMMGILPDVAETLEISIPRAGHFISSYALGVVVGAPTLTMLSSKFTQKRVLIGLMVWFTLFNTLTAFAPEYFSMLAARFMSGLPHGAFFGVGAVVARKLSAEGKGAQAMAVMFAGLTVANIIGVPAGTYISQNMDWRLTFGVVGLVGAITITSLIFLMPDMPHNSRSGSLKALTMFKKREPWLALLVTAIGTGGFFAWYSYIAPFLTEVAGFEENLVIYMLVLVGIGMTAGNLIGGRLADRFSPVSTAAVLLFCMSMSLILLTWMTHSKIAVLVMTFVIGTVALSLGAPVQMLMINASKGSEVLGSSINQAGFNIANALGAFLGGLPIAYGYGYISAEWVGAAMAFAGSVIAGLIVLSRRNRFNVVSRSLVRFRNSTSKSYSESASSDS